MALPYHLYILATQHHAIAQVRPIAYGTALVLHRPGPGDEHDRGGHPLPAAAETAMSMRRDLDQDRSQKPNFYYGDVRALKNVNLIARPKVTALIGPSGCGKSTFLRTLNRMNDVIAGARVEGEILLDGEDIYAPEVDVVELRRRVGMVFQKPNPFPKSIYDNVAYGLRDQRHERQAEARRDRREEPPRRRPLGRGQGPARRQSPSPSPAASSSASASPGRWPSSRRSS